MADRGAIVREAGFSLLEMVMALAVFGVGLALVIPAVSTARDHGSLDTVIWQVVTDLRNQQMVAEKTQSCQEIRFPFVGSTYYLFDGAALKYTGKREFTPPISYYEGYLHLPQTSVRFLPNGDVNQGGQIILKDPEGAVRNTVLYLQYGDMRVATGPLS